MPFTPDPVAALEQAIADRLSPLESWRLSLFADDQERSPKARANTTLFVGHTNSEYEVIQDDPVSIIQETATFLLQLTVTDLRSHSKAQKYMRAAIEHLKRYQPFALISPFLPVRYGDPRLDPEAGLWIYSGIVRAQWTDTPTERPLEEFKPVIPTSILLGMYISDTTDSKLRERTEFENSYAN